MKFSELDVNSAGRVSGILQLDFPLNSACIKLTATLYQRLYSRTDRGMLQASEQPIATRVLVDTPVAQTLVSLPFSFELTSMYEPGTTYSNGQLQLVAELNLVPTDTPHGTCKENIAVTLGKPSFTVYPNQQKQTIDGFGASGAWWAQYVGGMADSVRNQVADWLFSLDSGIGLSQYRYNVGGGLDVDIPDPWRTAETFVIDEGKYDWTRDANARWFLQAAKQRGVLDFTLFAVSPPAGITKSGHTYNKDKSDTNLDPCMYQRFAQYLADILIYIRDCEGVNFSTVSPFNEPEWAWEGNSQEGSPYTLSQILELSRVVRATLVKNGIQAQLLVPEAGAWEFIYGNERSYAQAFAGDPELASSTILAVHSYWSTDAQRRLAGQEMKHYPNLPIWQTEWCEMHGGRDCGIESALTLAHTVHADLTLANVSAWQHWLAVGCYDYRDALIYTDYTQLGDPQNVMDTKRLWALGNYSRFIRPGAVRIGVDSNFAPGDQEASAAVLMSAFTDETNNQLILVVVNQADTVQQVGVKIPDRSDMAFTPYRTSATENLTMLAPVTLGVDAAEGGAVGTLHLAPLCVTTFVAEYQRDKCNLRSRGQPTG